MPHEYITDLTAEYVRSRLTYDPDTGTMRWKPRPDNHSWTARYAGTEAGHPNTNGYVQIKLDGRERLRSRLVWLIVTGSWPRHHIDHINRDHTDDRFSNLRQATHRENTANSGPRRNSSTGVRGVFPLPSGRYRAKINVRGRAHHLGVFGTIAEASAAYDAAARAELGEFAAGTVECPPCVSLGPH